VAKDHFVIWGGKYISGFIPCNPGLAMGYNPDIHHRRSIRLRDYDYCSTGAYFVTICAFQRECLFGEVVNGEMQVNPFGEIVREEWQKTDILRENVTLDEFVIMPNHRASCKMIGSCY